MSDFRVNGRIDYVGRNEVTDDQSNRGTPTIFCKPELHGCRQCNLMKKKP
jgi:hypothetical protein